MSVTIPKAYDIQGYNNLSLAKKIELKRYARVMKDTATAMRQLMADLQEWARSAAAVIDEAMPTKGEHDADR